MALVEQEILDIMWFGAKFNEIGSYNSLLHKYTSIYPI